MSVVASATPAREPTPDGAVFLSYAREDSAAALKIATGLRAAGIAVWFDQNELRGGDAWDEKIRRQIKECALFLPIISANTQQRTEGYFRLEWRLADQRTHLMGRSRAFLLPVCVDATSEDEADVPDSFLSVQWTRLPGGEAAPEFCARVRSLLTGGLAAGVGVRGHGRREAEAAGVAPSVPAVGAGRSLVSRQTLTIAAIVVAGGGGAIWFWRGAGYPAESAAVRQTARTASTAASPVASESASAPNAPGKTIAVLPFENLSVDKANEYFSDGISDEISNVLGKVPGLRVAGRASAFSFKGRQVTDAEIAAKLGVALLLTGTVQTSGNQVRIGARLTSAADGFQVWSERFTRELKDIFSVQDEIATLIAGKLELELGAVRRTARSVDPEAHRLVLEGRYHSSLRTKDGFARAVETFGRALDRDPGFAEAHAGLAEVCVMRANYATQDGAGLDDGQADLAKAQAEAQRAIAIDAENPDAQAVLGYCDFIEGRPQEAERWYRRALEIAPNRSVFYAWRAMLRLGQGRLDEGLSDMEKTIALDPLWPVSLANYAEVLFRAGRAVDALQATERALNLRQGVYVPALGVRTQVLWALGRQEEAVAAARTIRTHLRQNPRRGADEAAIWVLVQSGHTSEAEAYREEYFGTLPARSQQRGFALGALGRFEEALPLLERTPSLVRRRLFWDPIWDPWRSDPRFRQLLATLGCTAEYATARATQERLLRERKAGR